LQPKADPNRPNAIIAIPLSLWDERDDTFVRAEQSGLYKLVAWAEINSEDFAAALKSGLIAYKI
jgi:hypothetical protein